MYVLPQCTNFPSLFVAQTLASASGSATGYIAALEEIIRMFDN